MILWTLFKFMSKRLVPRFDRCSPRLSRVEVSVVLSFNLKLLSLSTTMQPFLATMSRMCLFRASTRDVCSPSDRGHTVESTIAVLGERDCNESTNFV